MKENVENETIQIVTENIGEFPIQTGIGKGFLIMTQPFFFFSGTTLIFLYVITCDLGNTLNQSTLLSKNIQQGKDNLFTKWCWESEPLSYTLQKNKFKMD